MGDLRGMPDRAEPGGRPDIDDEYPAVAKDRTGPWGHPKIDAPPPLFLRTPKPPAPQAEGDRDRGDGTPSPPAPGELAPETERDPGDGAPSTPDPPTPRTKGDLHRVNGAPSLPPPGEPALETERDRGNRGRRALPVPAGRARREATRRPATCTSRRRSLPSREVVSLAPALCRGGARHSLCAARPLCRATDRVQQRSRHTQPGR